MNQSSKLALSPEELQLVTNTDWILTKRTIIEKVHEMFGSHAAFAQEYLQTVNLPLPVKTSCPKTAKGENYLQLPWLMLDYPRVFDKENVFAVRTMFWWGNFFSSTLHISGTYKTQFENNIAANLPLLQQHNYFICINKNEWLHYFEEDNYLPATSFTTEEVAKLFAEKTFIKLACKFPLQQWAQMPALLQQSFKTLLTVLEN